MNRVTNNVPSRNRHKKIMKLSKGYKASLSKLFITATQTVLKALKYSYKGRKNKKINQKRLWTNRINSICKINRLNYHDLKEKNIEKKIYLDNKSITKVYLIDKTMLYKIINNK